MSSYTCERKYDIEEDDAPISDERERRKTSRRNEAHRREHHQYRHQQPQIDIDEMEPSHEKRGSSMNASSLQDTVDDIVKDFTYLLSKRKQEEQYDNNRHGDKHHHEDSNDHSNYIRPLFQDHKPESMENNAHGVKLDEMLVDSSTEEEQLAASLGLSVQPQEQQSNLHGAFQVQWYGVDSTVSNEEEDFTVIPPSIDHQLENTDRLWSSVLVNTQDGREIEHCVEHKKQERLNMDCTDREKDVSKYWSPLSDEARSGQKDSNDHCDDLQSLLAAQDEIQIDSVLEEEQLATSALPPRKPGAVRVRGPEFTEEADDEFTVTLSASYVPTHDGEQGEAGLAVANRVNEAEEMMIPAATKYDPAAKLPLYQSRKFKLYMSALVALLLILIATVIAVVLTDEDPNDLRSPTAPPTTILEGKFREQFAMEVGDAVNIESSPQDRAADWIMFEDPLGLSPTAPNLIQRYHLTLFYFLTTNNGDEPWRSCNPPRGNESDKCTYIGNGIVDANATRWLSGTHECEWIGVFCNPRNNTIALEVSNQNISTTLPTEISSMPFLQAIALYHNEFSGKIPELYADMEQLISLELHYNVLTGTVPDIYWQASALQLLNVGSNLLSGTISTQLGIMTQMKGFFLFENNFKGTIPTEIGNARFLSYMYLYDNGLVGEIPTEMGQLALLKEFWISGNALEGRIPSQLGLIRDVEIFDMYENLLTGTIPEELYNLAKVTSFSVERNRLSGTISTSIGQLSNLEFFRVSTNDFTGMIPSEIGNLSNARLLWFHKTRFTGTVPESLCIYRPMPLQILQADCNPPENPSVPCLCCSDCCNRDTGVCLATT